MNEQIYHKQSLKLNYYEGPNSGAPILFIHGNMSRWQLYESIIEEIAQTKHVFALDLRGHGKSDHVHDTYFLKNHYEDVVSFIQDIINEPLTIIGHSLGGMIALMVAAYHPELAKQLIVLDPPLALNTITPMLKSQKEVGDKLISYCRHKQLDKLQAMLNDEASAVAMSLCDPNIIEITFNQPEQMIEGFDIEKLIPLIKCRTLLFRGEVGLGSMISDLDMKIVHALSSTVIDRQIMGLGHTLIDDKQVISEILQEISKV